MAPTPRKWKAAIKHAGVLYHLGSYVEEREAAIAYDKKAHELYGKDATLNFPHLTYEEIAAEYCVIKKKNDAQYHENLSKRHQGRRFETVEKTSKFIGVSRYKRSKDKPWRATIHYRGKQYNMGTFETEEAAARAYDQKAIEFYGNTARLNFPDSLVHGK
jgi:hypothetical protein